jgi:hypothetical protein
MKRKHRGSNQTQESVTMSADQEATNEPPARSVIVVCQCGARLTANAADAGSRLACPHCGALVAIPPLSSFEPRPIPLGGEGTASKQPKKWRFQFSLQTLLLTIVAIGLFLSLAVQLRNRSQEDGFAPIDHSWTSGTISVRAETRGGEVYALTDGNWPSAKPDYTIRYATWLASRSGQTILMSGTSQKLGLLHDSPFYEKAPPFGSESYRVECDYEIWAGTPGRSKLLAKNSVFSPWYDK